MERGWIGRQAEVKCVEDLNGIEGTVVRRT